MIQLAFIESHITCYAHCFAKSVAWLIFTLPPCDSLPKAQFPFLYLSSWFSTISILNLSLIQIPLYCTSNICTEHLTLLSFPKKSILISCWLFRCFALCNMALLRISTQEKFTFFHKKLVKNSAFYSKKNFRYCQNGLFFDHISIGKSFTFFIANHFVAFEWFIFNLHLMMCNMHKI